MSDTSFSISNKAADPTVMNQALCADLSVLFTSFIGELAQAIAQIGGKPLADQFEQQITRFAEQHGWSVLTGLAHLGDLRQRVPDVDARMLFSVYLSYTRYARALAGQILGEQMLKSVLAALLKRLPPNLVAVNARYELIYL
ncbi:hypothetical protein TFLX_04944 [Thermoflexales bacterium]|nr:hypothetical protein TFLX_04944 [Thermoflexales bacterium]